MAGKRLVVDDEPATLTEVVWIVGKAILFFFGVIVLGICVLPHESSGLVARLPLLKWFGVKHVFALVRGEQAA